jgi:ankyrin repeat protein
MCSRFSLVLALASSVAGPTALTVAEPPDPRTDTPAAVHLRLATAPDFFNEPDDAFPPYLFRVAEVGRFDLLELLLDHGADVNHCSVNHGTLLQYIARNGPSEMAEYLVRRGAVLDLYSAAALGKYDEAKRWLDWARLFGLQRWLLNRTTGHDTPLHWAVAVGQWRLAELFLDYGADLDASDLRWGAGQPSPTPLLRAVQSGRFEMVRFLAIRGADLEAKDWYGRTALHLAVNTGRYEIARFLLEDCYANPSPWADRSGYPINFEEGVPPSLDTPLHDAVGHGDARMIALLLRHGADPTLRNDSGQTPLDLIVRKLPAPVAAFLGPEPPSAEPQLKISALRPELKH